MKATKKYIITFIVLVFIVCLLQDYGVVEKILDYNIIKVILSFI